MDGQLIAASMTPSQLTAYLQRVDYGGSTDPTLATLRALVLAHGMHLPFENLDPLMGIPVEDLAPATLVEKMVRHRRGGYCYEHNSLFRGVLTAMGFEADALGGRVVWANPDGLHGPPTAQTHMALAVRIPGVDERYLVDVGFGGMSPTSPLRFETGDVQQTPHQPYRLLAASDGHEDRFVLETLIGDRWLPMYTFADMPRPLIDLQVGSWYVSTYPSSVFVVGVSASLVTADERWNLRGRHLSIHRSDGQTERIRFDNASQVLDTLVNRFGIDVGGIGDVHARISEVLDT